MDITGVLLSAITVMYILSAPRGRTKYHPLVFGLFLTVISAYYGYANGDAVYYFVGLAALAKAVIAYLRWSE